MVAAMIEFEENSGDGFSQPRFLCGVLLTCLGLAIGYVFIAARNHPVPVLQIHWVERAFFSALIYCIGVVALTLVIIGGSIAVGLRMDLLKWVSQFLADKVVVAIVLCALTCLGAILYFIFC